MFLTSLNRSLFSSFRKVPHRTVLIIPFVIQIFAAVGLVGYLSFRNGQKAINDLASQLQSEVSSRIIQHLDTYLVAPNQINQINLDAIELGLLNLSDFKRTGKYFWKQIQVFNVGYISYGNQKGEFIGVERLDDGTFLINEISQQSQLGKLNIYKTDSQGNRTQQIEVKDWNPQSEAWYTAPLKAGKPLWSEIYQWEDKPEVISVSSSYPVYDNRKKIIGVLSIDLILSQIGNFLDQLKVGKTGKTFILERNGLLVANSGKSLSFQVIAGQASRLKASESRDPKIRLTSQYLIQKFSELSKINNYQQFTFEIENQRQFVQVTPWRDKLGLDWLIVAVVPESDFMEQINANTRNTILLCVGALSLATILGSLTSRWITHPILKLSQASQSIANGELNQYVEVKGIKELEILAESFNRMADQLKDSFTVLEVKNADLQQAKEELAEAKEQLEAVLNAVPGSISWIGSDGLYLGVNRYMAESLNLPPAGIIGKEVGFFNHNSQFVEFMRQFLASSEEAASQVIEVKVDGEERYYLLAVQKYQQGTASVSVGIEVTERIKAQEALRLAEENYRSIFENALEGIFQSSPDGHFIRINPAMARIYGYESPEEMLSCVTNIDTQLYVNLNNRDEFRQLMEEQGQVKGLEYQAYQKDRIIIWVAIDARAVRDTSGKLLYYEGIVRDITLRKRQEAELKRQLQELQIEIDYQKREREVAKITQSDYFQEIQAEIASLDPDQFWG